MGFLQLRNVSKSFGTAAILHRIDLDVSTGEFLVLVGPSGCGKSTLLNLVAGLETVTSGTVLMRGQSITHVPPAARNMAMVFQSYALYPHMTVRQNLSFGLEMHGADRAAIAQAVADVSGRLQIEDLLDRKPARLSGGQRQRVAIGRALVRKPDVFLFDEPLSNLDAKLRVEMRTLIKKLHRELGTTFIYVTHDQIEAMTLADRIAVLRDGAIQQLGTPREIYEQPANVFVAGFMGSPAMNLLEVDVVHQDDGAAVQFALGSGEIISLPVCRSLPGLAAYAGRRCILGLRPESITAAEPDAAASATIAILTNRVDVIEPAGSDTFLISRMAGMDIIARVPSATVVRPGDRFRFAIRMDSVLFFNPESGLRIG
jgi:multiple sugar transport system ATP-binding protein